MTQTRGVRSTPVSWALMGLLAAAMVVNAGRHDYHVGYDIAAHLAYAKTLARGVLPTQAESNEFFTPPLSYVPASALMALGVPEAASLET